MKIPMIGPSYKSRSLPFSSQRTINLYIEGAEAEARDAAMLIGTPGLTQWIDLGGNRGCRGAVYMDGRLYCVIGTTLYSILEDGTTTNVGEIGGDDRLSVAINGNQVCIVSSQSGAFIYSLANGLEQITSADFYPSEKVVFIDQYFAHLKQSSQTFFLSAIGDGMTYDALDFATAEARPDLLLSIESDNGELWLFGEETSEVWSNTGAADFPFARVNGAVLQKGIAGRDCVARMDNSVYWLGSDGVVYRASGYAPQRVSTHAIETQIAALEWSDAFALTYSKEGHNFFILSFPTSKQTFVFDAINGMWHERSSRVANIDREWRVSHLVYAFGRQLAFDSYSGKIGEVDLDEGTEYGENIIRTRISAVMHGQSKRVFMPQLEIIMETGVGTGQTTPEPIVCYYPLNASAASLISLGYDGRLALTNTNQTGTYNVQSGLVSSEAYAAAALASAIALDSGTKAFEWNYSLPTIIGGAGAAAITLSAGAYPNPFSATPIARFEAVSLDDGSFTFAVYNGATQVYTNSGTASGIVTMIFDAASGGFAVKINGTLILLDNNAYTAQDAFLLASVTEAAGINVLYQDEQASVTLVSNAASLGYAEGNATTESQQFACAYALDDDGTLATAFGYGYAGPAVGDGQQMQYTTTGNAQVKILSSSGAVTSARFQRGANPIGFEASTNSYGGAGNAAGVAILITNSGGSIVNATDVFASADGDLLQFEVAADGTVSAKKNGAVFDISARWINMAGQKTVGATDYFCPYMYINDQQAGQFVDIQLVTDGASMAGTYSANAVDICGNTIGSIVIIDPIAVDASSVTDVCSQSVANPPTTLQADTSDGNPLILISYSDDGGRTFTNDREGIIGRIGAYLTRVRFMRLGSFYQRVMRLRISAAVKVAIIGAEANIEVER